MKLAAVLVLVLAAACAKSEKNVTGSPTPAETAPAATSAPCTTTAPPTPTMGADESTTTKPTVTIPDGEPPCKLTSQDIKQGDGAEAKADSTVTVQYVGVSWSTKKEFDSSWDRGEPATFPLNRVIKGWQEGIPGMKVGGRRELIIPPDLGYGPAGQGPDIGPNESLVFVIDLLKVN